MIGCGQAGKVPSCFRLKIKLSNQALQDIQVLKIKIYGRQGNHYHSPCHRGHPGFFYVVGGNFGRVG